jgi:hypothetical protein
MGHVNITSDRDHKVFVFIRDQLSDAARLVRKNADEQGLLRFGDKYDTAGAKLTVLLRQYWPPRKGPDGTLVGSVDIFANDLVLEPNSAPHKQGLDVTPQAHDDDAFTVDPLTMDDLMESWGDEQSQSPEVELEQTNDVHDAVPGRPTTHEDLLDIYRTRDREHECGFLLAGELDEAALILVYGEPALGQNRFRLKHQESMLGYIELDMRSYELPRFGCGVTFYAVVDETPPRAAVEAAFIELLDGARPSGGQ